MPLIHECLFTSPRRNQINFDVAYTPHRTIERKKLTPYVERHQCRHTEQPADVVAVPDRQFFARSDRPRRSQSENAATRRRRVGQPMASAAAAAVRWNAAGANPFVRSVITTDRVRRDSGGVDDHLDVLLVSVASRTNVRRPVLLAAIDARKLKRAGSGERGISGADR